MNSSGKFISTICFATLSGCQTEYVCADAACQRRADLQSLPSICLKLVEHDSPVVAIVLPDGLDKHAAGGFTAIRPTYTQQTMPQSGDWSVPPGYFVLEKFEVDSDGALCVGTLGPALKPAAAGYADQCGKHFEIPLTVETLPAGKSVWKSDSYKITECSSTNVITPVK